jgi:hypothetical protein
VAPPFRYPARRARSHAGQPSSVFASAARFTTAASALRCAASECPRPIASSTIGAGSQVPYAVIGGIAFQVRSDDPRTTLDIDVAVVDRAQFLADIDELIEAEPALRAELTERERALLSDLLE